MRTAAEDLPPPPPLTWSLQRNTKDYRLCAEIHNMLHQHCQIHSSPTFMDVFLLSLSE